MAPARPSAALTNPRRRGAKGEWFRCSPVAFPTNGMWFPEGMLANEGRGGLWHAGRAWALRGVRAAAGGSGPGAYPGRSAVASGACRGAWQRGAACSRAGSGRGSVCFGRTQLLEGDAGHPQNRGDVYLSQKTTAPVKRHHFPGAGQPRLPEAWQIGYFHSKSAVGQRSGLLSYLWQRRLSIVSQVKKSPKPDAPEHHLC